MYEQRAAKEIGQFEPQGPWLPAGVPSVRARAPGPAGPWYVVVDEMHGTGCRFTVDRWPDIDPDGRLVFDTDRTSLQWVDTTRAYDVIREARQASADGPEQREIANRALRVGDVFAVWPSAVDRLGLSLASIEDGPAIDDGAARDEGPAGGLVDVTGEARVATRAAVDAVATGELTEGDLERLGIPSSAVEETPDSTSAP